MRAIVQLLLAGFFLSFSSNPLFAQWVQTNGSGGSPVLCLAVSGTNLFAGTYRSGIFLSTNNGISWNAVDTGLTYNSVSALAVSGTNLFAGTLGFGVFLSTNSGASWTSVNSGLPFYTDVYSLVVSGKNLFVGIAGGSSGVFRSTDNGASWTATNSGLTDSLVWSFALSDTNLFAGLSHGGVFLSTNNGANWTAANTGLTNTGVWSLAVSGTNIFAGTSDSGAFLSTNNGKSWTAVSMGLANTGVRCFAVSGTNLFAATGSGGVFLSTNNGTSWTDVNSGLPYDVYSLAVSGTNLFAGTFHSGVWRRPLSEMIMSAEKFSSRLPTRFNLNQNYPNPFNPVTTISFDLSSLSHVSLKVFDALGREVATILSEELPSGSYARQWYAPGMVSGVYFYRMQAGSFIETRKLMLLK